MSIKYAVKPEQNYIGGFFGDNCPALEIKYEDGIGFPLISITDFELWFGSKNLNDIGMLRDFAEYSKNNCHSKSHKIVSVKPSANVKPKSLVMNRKYHKMFEKLLIFKCIPVHTSIKAHSFLNVYLSLPNEISNNRIEIAKDDAIRELQNLLINMIISDSYNDMTFDITISNEKIRAKIYDISRTLIVAEHTNFHIKSSINIYVRPQFGNYTSSVE
jgi:hypothetical protein